MQETTQATTQEVAAAATQAVKVPAAVAKRAAEKARESAEKAKRWAMSDIENYSKYIQKATERLQRADEEADEESAKWAQAWAKLVKARLKPEELSYPRWAIEVVVSEKSLKRVYAAIGRLDGGAAEKEIADADTGTVWVNMPSVEYPFVRVKFMHKLKANERCKIVTEVVPARVEKKLVCDVGEKA